MRSQNWLKIWQKKGLNKTEDQHVLDGWDLNSEKEYREIAYSCLSENENFLREPNLKTVEFGCGSGAFISALQAGFSNLEIEGLDYSENLINAAREKNQSVNFNVLDMNSPIEDWLKVLNYKKYDVIFSFGTLLYFNSESEIQSVLEKMTSILSSKGLIILGEVNDLENQIKSKNVRKESLKNREETDSNMVLDQLYLSKKMFLNFAIKNNFACKILPLPSWYPAGAYRYHVTLKKRN